MLAEVSEPQGSSERASAEQGCRARGMAQVRTLKYPEQLLSLLDHR